ncbi:cryptochrome/photolyase family protein [Caldimonas tepidiphila]|uniref:cryptochrome/photolyase family protein n=1 Tax=Caldimonas tepidiphila TaxID=2315841 RepID=UPI000E5A69C6|nr:deoxyribodipyrimidine photo-lyase [Caldimonas tepidiphila]
MDKTFDAALVWLRRDLRVRDNAALHHALHQSRRVWCAFVFDTEILEPLPRADRRVEFIRDSLLALDAELAALGLRHGHADVGLIVLHGAATQALPALADRLHVQAVFAAHDYEPAAKARDARVLGALADAGIAFHTTKDQVVFEGDEVLTGTGLPYSVFTPYRNNWLRQVDEARLAEWPVERHAAALAPLPAGFARGVPTLAELGFEPTNLHELRLAPGESGAQAMFADFLERIDHYHETRDFPAVKGPSYLSVHLRFGTVSPRQLAREALERARAGSRGAAVWLDELIWREFYQQLLHHHPRVVTHAFRPEYDAIKWEHGKHADVLFAAWCAGRTGYPLVDAGMRQLNQTGYMHNRLRMVTASFLCKDLGIDWRRGERYFAEKLNDHDLAANNGGWQWAASTGCDAQPWFRIFNPVTQSQKFDPHGRFIRRYLPELAALPDEFVHAPWKARPVDLAGTGFTPGEDYPAPIVDHDAARQKTLLRYESVKKG